FESKEGDIKLLTDKGAITANAKKRLHLNSGAFYLSIKPDQSDHENVMLGDQKVSLEIGSKQLLLLNDQKTAIELHKAKIVAASDGVHTRAANEASVQGKTVKVTGQTKVAVEGGSVTIDAKQLVQISCNGRVLLG